MKPALTVEQQLDLLIERGMLLDINREDAISFLLENNYYRLSGYFKLFSNSGSDTFIDGFCFSKLKELYIFDFDLRRIINDLLEEVEITTKTQIAYNLSIGLGADFYLNTCFFHNPVYHKNFINKVEEEKNSNSTSPIVRRYEGEVMPIWALVELLSFGKISKMFSNLKNEYRKMVSGEGKYYDYNHHAFQSYLYVAVQLRNRCAHRARLYARYINASISFSKKDIRLFEKYGYPYKVEGSQSTVFFAIYAAFKLLKNKESKQSYIDKIQSLFVQYNNVVNPNKLGFFDYWDNVLLED